MKKYLLPLLVLFGFVLDSSAIASTGLKRVHALAMNGEPKYGPDFKHFDYVNPDAPKGGTLRRAVKGTYDSFNPFISKGLPVAGIGLLYDSLTVQSDDEPFTQYGLIADWMEVPEDHSKAIFHVNTRARFHDGMAITAEDVAFSFKTLIKYGRPNYRQYYANVDRVNVLDSQRIEFIFKPGKNLELPLILGQLRVFPKHYWEKRKFYKSTLEPPVGSSAYRISNYKAGKSIQYERVKNYWAKDIPVNKGKYNFDYIEFEYLRDATVSLEAFKNGAFDFHTTPIKNWVNLLKGEKFDKKLIIKEAIRHNRPQGAMGYVFNLRKPIFQDKRVRKAIRLVFDFEWLNKRFFYGKYIRNKSFFDNSELAAGDLPTKGEIALLKPFQNQLPKGILTQPINRPETNGTGNIRKNLRKASQLLKQAGWIIKKGRLIHSKSGKAFRFSILLGSKSQAKYVHSFRNNLKRLGITVDIQIVDTSQFISRIRSFDYDMTFRRMRQSESPGNEQRELWSSKSADIKGSTNYIGIKDPVVDALIEKIIAAPDRKSLITATKALDRVLQWGVYMIHAWQSDHYRVAYWNKFERPHSAPTKSFGLYNWWVNPEKEKKIRKFQKQAF